MKVIRVHAMCQRIAGRIFLYSVLLTEKTCRRQVKLSTLAMPILVEHVSYNVVYFKVLGVTQHRFEPESTVTKPMIY